MFYISFKDGYEDKREEVAPGVFVEMDKRGQPFGIEILNASEKIGKFFRDSISRSYTEI